MNFRRKGRAKLEMGVAARMADAQEMRPLIHGERQEPANLIDERSLTFFSEGRVSRVGRFALFLVHQIILMGRLSNRK